MTGGKLNMFERREASSGAKNLEWIKHQPGSASIYTSKLQTKVKSHSLGLDSSRSCKIRQRPGGSAGRRPFYRPQARDAAAARFCAWRASCTCEMVSAWIFVWCVHMLFIVV